jgi:hypothetical protein
MVISLTSQANIALRLSLLHLRRGPGANNREVGWPLGREVGWPLGRDIGKPNSLFAATTWAPHPQVLRGQIGAERNRERDERPMNVSQLLNSENQVPIQPGMYSQWISVVPIQPASCIPLASSLTDTSSTNRSITPVMISSRL